MFNAKTVLVVGEDALAIYASSGGKSKRLGIIYWDEENIVERIYGYLLREGKKRPVAVLYDMLEQQYKKEQIPNLSVMDRRTYIDRKMKVVFPSNPMRAALFLKNEAEERAINKRDATETKPYIFASIPDVAEIQIVYNAILKSELDFLGLAFLPVEGASLLQKFAEKQAKTGYRSKWNILLSSHETGGLRQIVTRNGDLALTRLTAMSDNANDSDIWANEALTEFNATLSYLLRFGYSADQPLSVCILYEDKSIEEYFRKNVAIECNVAALPPREFAKMAGLSVRADTQYGEAIHAAWTSKKTSFILPVASGAFKQLYVIRKNLGWARKAIYLAALVGLAYATFLGKQTIDMYSLIEEQRSSNATLQSQLNRLELSIPKISEDQNYEQILSLLDIKDTLENEGLKSINLFGAIANAMPSGVLVSHIDFKIEDKRNDGFDDDAPPADAFFEDQELEGEATTFGDEGMTSSVQLNRVSPSNYEIILSLSFDSALKVEDAVFTTNRFRDSLRTTLVGYEVEVTEQAANLANNAQYSEQLSSNINLNNILPSNAQAGLDAENANENTAESPESETTGMQMPQVLSAKVSIKGPSQ